MSATSEAGSQEATKIANVIGPNPPRDGREWDCQCARCGSSMGDMTCEACGGEGTDGHDCGEDCCCCLYPEDNVPCGICDGDGAFSYCLSSPEWCEANPLPGREAIGRGEVEWFCTERDVPAPSLNSQPSTLNQHAH